MRTTKSVIDLIMVLVPVVCCGSLVYYFLDLSGGVENALEFGLGPTVLGLSIVGLLFCIPLIMKIVRLFGGPRTPRPGSGSDPTTRDDGNGNGHNADVMIARYVAQRSVERSLRTVPRGCPEAEAARKAALLPLGAELVESARRTWPVY